MMSDCYDHYHRWEPLAEFHFNIDSEDEEFDEDNYIYCLCSRVFIRDGVKTYYADKEDGSESDVENIQDSHSHEWDQSHVHFSLDTDDKVKCEKDEGASCYCSASHTDNCCSTDEHDPTQVQGTISHALQPSDSGADLTYQDCHSDYTTDRLEKMAQDLQTQIAIESDENYVSEDTWEKFWAVNGERIIWASWIKKYSDYINPAYLGENQELLMDDNNIPKQHSDDQIYKEQVEQNKKVDDDESMRERKFSYDSKVNPYKKGHGNQVQKSEKINEMTGNKEDWVSGRRRSCSEHERIVSPRTLATTDSMTNVTKMTISSCDMTSSHVTSESSPTDDYSVSSSTSDDPSNDQTRIANFDENLEVPDELDTEQYWQFLWKKHFGEQYALHYANYIEHNPQTTDLPEINIETIPEERKEKVLEIECENSEGNSQEMPTIIEMQAQVDQMKLDDKVSKPRKRNKKASNKYLGSVGVLLQNLLKEEQIKNVGNEIVEAGEGNKDKVDSEPVTVESVGGSTESSNLQQSVSNNFINYSYDDGDDDPPEEVPVTLKRSHELDEEEISSEKIKSTFEIMGFALHSEKMPKGQLVYRKRLSRLRPPRSKRFGVARKTYFDDDGNAYIDQNKDSVDEREMQTDDESPEVKYDAEKIEPKETEIIPTNDESPEVKYDAEKIEPKKTEIITTNDVQDEIVVDIKDSKDVSLEPSAVPLRSDGDLSLSDLQENNEEQKIQEVVLENPVTQDVTKRRRRPKRYSRLEDDHLVSEMPAELRDDPKMLKYWKKRHSLFHRFDEGIKLDRESWFSVTPENVAWHIANKCVYDVVLDAFCGAGGNTIQFARICKKVIAIDIDPAKIEMAKHNATVYGVADRIEFIVGDFFEIAPKFEADMVFLSPPWGGPNYSDNQQYDIETMLEPRPASELMCVARLISPTIALYLPRNTRSDQILSLAKEVNGSVEVEQSYLDKRFVAITAYFY